MSPEPQLSSDNRLAIHRLASGGDSNAFANDVRAGLARTPKTLSPKYFYDEAGSALFERITELPEYYLTRTERKLLESEIPAIMNHLRPRALVELGAERLARLHQDTIVIPHAVEEAERRGMYVILYDDGMYPSGSASGQVVQRNPAHAARGLVKIDLRPGEQPKLPDGEGWNLVAVVGRPNGQRLAVADRPSGGVLRGLHYIGEGSTLPQMPGWRAGDQFLQVGRNRRSRSRNGCLHCRCLNRLARGR